MAFLHAGLVTLCSDAVPDAVVVERAFVAASPRAALVLGHARGVVLAAAAAAGLPVAEVTPAEVKRAIAGHGAAEKPEVQSMVRRLLRLAALPPRDAADALAIALCHAHALPLVRRIADAVGTDTPAARARGAAGTQAGEPRANAGGRRAKATNGRAAAAAPKTAAPPPPKAPAGRGTPLGPIPRGARLVVRRLA